LIRSITLLFSLFAIALTGASGAAELAGVKIDDKVKSSASGPELVLNGMGLRTRYKFKVYVAALYLPEKKPSAAEVIALKGPKRIQLWLMRDVEADQMSTALIEGLNANLSSAELEKSKAQIQQLNATLVALRELKEGDVMTFDLLPGAGTRISVNGKLLGTPIAGDDFHVALLKIWLGDNPVQADLKKGLLGQT
jgi:chalcone isomerase-like protein